MLKHSSQLCRSVLFRQGLDPLLDAAGSIHVPYAACSVVKAFTANLHGIARVQAQQQRRSATAAAGGAAVSGGGLVIHDSAVRVSMFVGPVIILIISVLAAST